MALTATAVSHAKGKEKPYKLADSGGLYLLVNPQGNRYWRFNYRFESKFKTLAFGVYPDVSLADARAKRDAARKVLAAGDDPVERREHERREAKLIAGETFEKIAEEWLARLEREGRAERTMRKMRWLIEFAYPALAKRPMSQITAPELLEVLRKIEARGRYETAIRLRGTFGALFRYAIATGRAQRDVSFDLRGALINPKTNHRAALLDPKKIPGLLNALAGYRTGQVLTRMRLAPAETLARPSLLAVVDMAPADFSPAFVRQTFEDAVGGSGAFAAVPVNPAYGHLRRAVLPGPPRRFRHLWGDR